MEDSNYVPNCVTGDFQQKPGSTTTSLSQPDSIFDLKFHDLANSENYRYLKYGFQDEEDFEEFKQELQDFQRLKKEVGEECLDFEFTPSPRRRKSTRRQNIKLPVLSNGRNHQSLSDFNEKDTQFSHLRDPTTDAEDSKQHYLPHLHETFLDPFPNRRHSSREKEVFEYPKRIHIRETSRLSPVPRISSREYLAYKLPNSPLSQRRSKNVGNNNDNGLDFNLISDLCNTRDNKSSNFIGSAPDDDFWDFKLSNLTGLLSRKRRDKCNMDSPTVDDHFQEFERFYETIHSHGNSPGLDLPKSDGRYLDDDPDEWLISEKLKKSKKSSSRFSSNSSLNDVFSIEFDEAFSDFFNTDEDFVEFEREFERVRFNRRSRAFNDLKRTSSCDIFSDVKSYCDRNKRESLATGTNREGSLKMTIKPDKVDKCSDSVISESKDNNGSKMWNTLEDWDYVLNKLKRNSRLFTDGMDYLSSDVHSRLPGNHQLSSESLQSKSRDCQYTCHHTCVPSVTLDCTSVSTTPVASTPDGSAVETSLSDREPLISPKPQIPQVLQTSSVTDNVSANKQAEDNIVVNNVQSESTPLLSPPTEPDQTLEPAHEDDETDSGYRSGTIPDEKLPKHKGEATLNREELRRKIDEYNKFVPSANFEPEEGGETFQGFLKVTLNFIRPITMSLGVRPPSIYEMLTKEHIVEENTQSIAFYMPRDTVKSIHTSSKTTTKEVITGLLKKFHIIDHPRKFAMYEQEFDGHKIVKLRRVTDKESPLNICLNWNTEYLKRYRLVLQENETGEIVWDGFSLPELNNFMIVLEREESEYISQLQYKYKVMRRIITQRLKELRKERKRLSGATSPTGSSSPSSPINGPQTKSS